MGYSKEHVEATRARILEVAGNLMRKRGLSGASLGQIMKSAGLTHGGFYAHFTSKDELFETVAGEQFDFYNQLKKLNDNPEFADVNRAAFAASYYLDRNNSERVANACTMASATQDIARSRWKVKSAFTQAFQRLVSEFKKAMGKTDESSEQAAYAALASCVGGLILSRALEDDEISEKLLAACKANVEQLVA